MSTIATTFLEHKPAFYARLIEVGYSASAAKKQCCLLVELAVWAEHHKIFLEDLPVADTDAFFGCRRARGKPNRRTPRSLDPLFDYLRHVGVVGAPARNDPTSPLE
jgi:hypothetical protein